MSNTKFRKDPYLIDAMMPEGHMDKIINAFKKAGVVFQVHTRTIMFSDGTEAIMKGIHLPVNRSNTMLARKTMEPFWLNQFL